MASIEKRTTDTGETSYRVKIRLKGYPTQTATFKRLTDAKKWTQDTESAIREGRHFKTTEAKKHTLGPIWWTDTLRMYCQQNQNKPPHNAHNWNAGKLKLAAMPYQT